MMNSSAITPIPQKTEQEVRLSLYFIANISYPIIKLRMVQDNAAETLAKAKVLASKLAFNWKEIRDPKSGQCFLIYMSTKLENSPPDGVTWLEKERTTKYVLADKKVLHVCERRNGKVEGNPSIRMVKRRYYLESGSEMQIQLLHYLEETDDQNSEAPPKVPVNINQEIRATPGAPSDNMKQFPGKPPNFPDQVLSHNMAVGEEPSHIVADASKPGPKPSAKKKGGKHMGNKVPVRDPSTLNTHSNPAPTEPTVFGDELDLIALRDVALFRFRRNHENLADLFSPAVTQKTIETLRKPLVPANYSELLSLRKERNLAEIRALKELKPYDKEGSNFLYEQINHLRKASSPEEIATCQQRIHHRFGPLVDRRRTWRPVSSPPPHELPTPTTSQFLSL